MTFPTSLQWLKRGWGAGARSRGRPPRTAGAPRRSVLRLEVLEDRSLLSAFTVNSLGDTGAGSGLTGDLRYCVANATSGSDTINFNVTGTINLESALPALDASVAIQGPGADHLTVERDLAIPMDGPAFGIFSVGSAAAVQISGLTISNGEAISGGGIYNAGTLTISYCTISGNFAFGGGAGIDNEGTLTVSDSTLSDNWCWSSTAYGGGIYNGGTATVSNSTLSGNQLLVNYGGGGGIYNGGTLRVSDSTLSGNYTDDTPGGGIANDGTVTVADTIVAGNTAPFDTDVSGVFSSLGYNLIGIGDGATGFNGPGDQMGTGSSAIDPLLGPLQDNGGPTQTMALLPGSPAIGKGDPTATTATAGFYDQRGPGFDRIVNGRIDIGAFEVQSGSPTQTLSLAVSGFPSSTTAGTAGNFMVTALNADGTTDASYTGTVHFASTDPKAILPGDAALTNGVGQFIATLFTAGTQSITATDTTAGLTARDGGITVNPAAASQFILSGPTSIAAGAPFSVTLTVEDAYGNVAIGYPGTVHFTSTDRRAVLPASYTFTTGSGGDDGTHTFAGLVLRTAGPQTITVTDTLDSSLCGSVTINVLKAKTSRLTASTDAFFAAFAADEPAPLRHHSGRHPRPGRGR